MSMLACFLAWKSSYAMKHVLAYVQLSRAGLLLTCSSKWLCACATLLIAINKKVRKYLGWDTDKPAGALILCRALKQRNMHTFHGMVGYCMKDCDEAHFQKVDHNISADDQNDGIEVHSLYGADALKNKVCLMPLNVFDYSLMFWRFKLNHPTGNRFPDVLQRMQRSDWFHARWEDNRRFLKSNNRRRERQLGVEATHKEDLATNGDICPLARLHDVLCDISIELRADNPAEQRPLRVKMTSRFDELTFVLQNVTMNDLAMHIAMLEMHMQNLSKQVGVLKIQLNKLAALV
ncbi:hypothetical protein L7F22_064164 [Adiantum nelumboides]|nr:hypothetical protein [Adiantum nelumboides]